MHERKLFPGNISLSLHCTYISWSQGFNATIQLVLVLTYRLFVSLDLPLEVDYFHLQWSHMAITMGTRHGVKILLRQNHSLKGTRPTEQVTWALSCVQYYIITYMHKQKQLHATSEHLNRTVYFRLPARGALMITGGTFGLHCAR